MAVVTKYGNGITPPGGLVLAEVVNAQGRVRQISSQVGVANGDSINSLHYFGKVPSNGIILPQSSLVHSAITSLSDYDIGLYLDGVLVDIDILADGLTLASAGTKSPIAAVATADLTDRLWELLGLSSDPGVEYQIVATMKAAATAAGTIHMALQYAIK